MTQQKHVKFQNCIFAQFALVSFARDTLHIGLFISVPSAEPLAPPDPLQQPVNA